MKKLSYYTILFLLTTLLSCSDNEDGSIYDLVLSDAVKDGKIELIEKTSVEVGILVGNGEYSVESSNKDIASVSLTSGIFTIDAHKTGTAKVTVKDKFKQVMVDVTVIPKEEILGIGK